MRASKGNESQKTRVTRQVRYDRRYFFFFLFFFFLGAIVHRYGIGQLRLYCSRAGCGNKVCGHGVAGAARGFFVQACVDFSPSLPPLPLAPPLTRFSNRPTRWDFLVRIHLCGQSEGMACSSGFLHRGSGAKQVNWSLVRWSLKDAKSAAGRWHGRST